ncbi:transposase [Anaeromusa acidaminophila]|uniref:transposase n=1 Tax=Anaeromusa acidaminophila TaxID=81464 RepID=UPI00039EA318
MKTVSARLLFKEFPEIKKQLWGGSLWSPSYFLASVGEVKLADVKRYVENQNHKDV